jgi:alcohol dehydrogenase class IV
MDYNARAISIERWRPLRAALKLPPSTAPGELAAWLGQFIRGLGLPAGLLSQGVTEATFDAMAKEAMRMAMIGNNVREATAEDCLEVLEKSL